jgi:hypothetical protein
LIRRNQFFKLNEAVSFENFCTPKCGAKTFHWKAEESSLDTLIERAAEMEWSNL